MEILRLRDVAQMVGISAQTLQRWIRHGRGPVYRRTPGRLFLFRRQDVEAWIADMEQRPELQPDEGLTNGASNDRD